ncbi:hypothetical protein ABVF61_23570 [Roseibium sp. HPY-6]|uniref:hypothetical protein n=1 Tax=Roseibium sp. HPY-6 TaxID=3229852 RepID=UPI00338F2656
MKRLKPAYPNSFYVVGAFAFVTLMLVALVQPAPESTQLDTVSIQTSSPQILAMDLTQ